MAVVGAELASLTRLEAAVAQQRAALEQLRASLANQIAATEWTGQAADRFRATWAEEHEPALRRLEAALQEASSEVARRRTALEAAGA
ncbi:MAG: WXG100 family type VII secretion target [Actinobacteria bacterium]|nr:WXG100 family type VII secretion target [Actinomycetota bacterium]